MHSCGVSQIAELFSPTVRKLRSRCVETGARPGSGDQVSFGRGPLGAARGTHQAGMTDCGCHCAFHSSSRWPPFSPNGRTTESCKKSFYDDALSFWAVRAYGRQAGGLRGSPARGYCGEGGRGSNAVMMS